MRTKEKIIEILRDNIKVMPLGNQNYSFKLYFDKVANDIYSRFGIVGNKTIKEVINQLNILLISAQHLTVRDVSPSIIDVIKRLESIYKEKWNDAINTHNSKRINKQYN